MDARFTIVGLGEALFDLFPSGAILGGAPLNVAFHAHQLLSRVNGRGVTASRVGQDALGRQIADELKTRGMTADYLQGDPDKPTGQVYVSVDDKGQPTFEIVKDVAWDWMQFDFDLEDLSRRCDAICFGTLAQRNGQSRNTIYRALTTATRAVRMFDVNLRQQYYDRQILLRSCEMSTAVKLNDQELPIVSRQLALGVAEAKPGDRATQDAAVTALMKRFPNVKLVALTRGAQGTVLYTGNARHESEPVSYPMAEKADAVGAGDACSAGLLTGMVLRLPIEKTLALANHAGAFVASRPGATPTLPDAVLRMASA